MATFPPGFKHLRKSAVGHRRTRSVHSPNVLMNTHETLRIMRGLHWLHTKSHKRDGHWWTMDIDGSFCILCWEIWHMPGTCPAAKFWSQGAHRRPQNSLAYSHDQPLRSSPRSPMDTLRYCSAQGWESNMRQRIINKYVKLVEHGGNCRLFTFVGMPLS